MKPAKGLIVGDPLAAAEKFLDLDVGWQKTTRGDGAVVLERESPLPGHTVVVVLFPGDWPRNPDGSPQRPPLRLLNS